jgi:aspartate carbamoyltransferase catalytic subunit
MPLHRKHLLDLDDFSRDEITQVLDTAESMAEILQRPISRVPTLRGKTIVNVFFEASTRTRVSFELAGKYLSADVINVAASGSSVEKGESLVDTLRTIQALGADMVVMRHSESGAPYLAVDELECSVINAGDGWHAHPSQALLDLYTVRQKLGDLEGKKLVIVGDILHSRVARSNIWGFTRMGMRVVLCGPATLLPPGFEKISDANGLLSVELDADKAIDSADVVMALRIQKERMDGGLLPDLREYSNFYGVNRRRLAKANPAVLVMHPGPMNQGVEISSDVAYGASSVIENQVANGLAIRMAIFYLLAGGR